MKCIPIRGYENDYSICEDSTVLSTRPRERVRGGPMKGTLNDSGYPILNLYSNGKPRLWRIHRLVAEHFIPNPDGKLFVNHKDSNRTNNHVSNLEWCTRQENMTHAKMANRMARGERAGLSVLTENDVWKIRELHKTIGYRKIAKRTGFKINTIVALLKGRSWSWLQ